MVFGKLVVKDRILPPVMRDIAETCRNGGITRCLDLLAVRLELIHRIVCAGFCNACRIQHFHIDEHRFPETVCGYCILLAVHQRRCNQIVVHVRRIFRILCANFINRNYLTGLDKTVRVRAVKEEEHIRFGAGLKVCCHSRVKCLVRACGGVHYCVPCLRFPRLHRILIVLCVRVLACKCGCHH